MFIFRSRRRARLAAVLMALTTLIAACGDDGGDEGTEQTDQDASSTDAAGGSAEEVLGPIDQASGEPIRVGLVSDGAYAAADNSMELDVADAAVAYLNERRAGIAGRPIELVTCVTEGDPARGTDCGNQMVEEGVVAVLVGSSAVLESVWQPVSEANVPTIFGQATTDSVLADDTTSFVLADFEAGVVEAPIAVAEEAGVDKVTVVVIDVPAAVETYEGQVPGLFEDAGLELELVRVPPGTADMTAQLQSVVAGDPGLVQVLGNDTFCISAFEALEALGFDGPISAIAPCITDATRQAVPGDVLEGISTPSPAPVGDEGEATALYRAVAETYGDEIDLSRPLGHTMFATVTGFALALDGLTGDVTPETVISTMKAMPDQELPNGGGLHYRCNGRAVEGNPAICTRGILLATLDSSGHPTGYEPSTTDPIED